MGEVPVAPTQVEVVEVVVMVVVVVEGAKTSKLQNRAHQATIKLATA